MTYFPFILFSPPNRGNKTNGGWGGLLWWVVSDDVAPQDRRPHDFFGGVGCAIKYSYGGRGG